MTTEANVRAWVISSVLAALRAGGERCGDVWPVSVLDIDVRLSDPRPSDGVIAYCFARSMPQNARLESILWALEVAVERGQAVRVSFGASHPSEHRFRPVCLLEALAEAASES